MEMGQRGCGAADSLGTGVGGEGVSSVGADAGGLLYVESDVGGLLYDGAESCEGVLSDVGTDCEGLGSTLAGAASEGALGGSLVLPACKNRALVVACLTKSANMT